MQIKQRLTKTIAYDLQPLLNCWTEYHLTVLVILSIDEKQLN